LFFHHFFSWSVSLPRCPSFPCLPYLLVLKWPHAQSSKKCCACLCFLHSLVLLVRCVAPLPRVFIVTINADWPICPALDNPCAGIVNLVLWWSYFLLEVGKRSSYSGNFTPFFDEISRISLHNGENSSTKEIKLTIPICPPTRQCAWNSWAIGPFLLHAIRPHPAPQSVWEESVVPYRQKTTDWPNTLNWHMVCSYVWRVRCEPVRIFFWASHSAMALSIVNW